jgi:hypothetical protein
MKKLFYLCIALVGMSASAQVGIGVPTADINASAQLEVSSTSKGFLAPRMTQAQKNNINSPAAGLLVYQTDAASGFYYFDGSVWQSGLGPQGPQGATGPQGAQGVAGATGPMGPQGIQGIAGATGAQGLQGVAGNDGLDGATGPMGPQGPAGNDGLDGATGPMGPMGPQGAQGPQGVAGATGAQGLQGVAGNDGLDGATGPMGPIGPQGPQGIDGVAGVPGPQGDMGAQGPQGDMGPQGPQGEVGMMGPQGEMGPAGIDGVAGVPGPQGEMGPQGPQGDMGYPGPPGLDGPQGPQGEMGPQGPSGTPADLSAYATIVALNTKAPIASPVFTGSITTPGVIFDAGNWQMGPFGSNFTLYKGGCCNFITVDGAGRMGIGGNYSPSYPLDVQGEGRFTSALRATSFIKTGGTSSQYLMADGSSSEIDLSGYATTSSLANFVDLTNNQTINGNKYFSNNISVNNISIGNGNSNNVSNTVFGNNALVSIQSGESNIAIGRDAAKSNNSGSSNVVIGNGANYYNESSSDIVAIGVGALHAEKGAGNVAIGSWAGHRGNISDNLTNSVFLGKNTSAGGGAIDNSVALGNGANVDASNTIQLGNGGITDVKTSGAVTASGFKVPNGTSSQYLMADGSISPGAVSTIGAIAESSTANGVIITSGVLRLAPADATNGGIVTTGSQSFAGSKTFGGQSSTTSAAVEVNSTTQGFLPPRMTEVQRNAISSPVAGLLLWCTNCGASGEIQVYNGTAWTNMMGGVAQTPPPALGNFYQGGIIFYLLQPGDPGYDANTPHGLIAAIEDQGNNNVKWDQFVYSEIPGINDGIGYGSANTTLIINSIGSSTNFAAGLARAYRGGGYSDWYVPSLNELNQLYVNRSYFTGSAAFTSTAYWSSSQFANWAAIVQDLNAGWTQGRNRGDLASLRAIRSF